MVENGGKHPAGSSAYFIPRAVVKDSGSTYPTVKLIKNWDENSASKGRHSMLADAVKYAREFGLDLDLTKPNATCQVASTGDEIIDIEVTSWLVSADDFSSRVARGANERVSSATPRNE